MRRIRACFECRELNNEGNYLLLRDTGAGSFGYFEMSCAPPKSPGNRATNCSSRADTISVPTLQLPDFFTRLLGELEFPGFLAHVSEHLPQIDIFRHSPGRLLL